MTCASLFVFSVQDQGSGMSLEELEQIFIPFSRSGAKTGGGENTGLGLAITQKIMDMHKGEIAVTSKEGSGTTFTLSFPF